MVSFRGLPGIREVYSVPPRSGFLPCICFAGFGTSSFGGFSFGGQISGRAEGSDGGYLGEKLHEMSDELLGDVHDNFTLLWWFFLRRIGILRKGFIR